MELLTQMLQQWEAISGHKEREEAASENSASLGTDTWVLIHIRLLSLGTDLDGN